MNKKQLSLVDLPMETIALNFISMELYKLYPHPFLSVFTGEKTIPIQPIFQQESTLEFNKIIELPLREKNQVISMVLCNKNGYPIPDTKVRLNVVTVDCQLHDFIITFVCPLQIDVQ